MQTSRGMIRVGCRLHDDRRGGGGGGGGIVGLARGPVDDGNFTE